MLLRVRLLSDDGGEGESSPPDNTLSIWRTNNNCSALKEIQMPSKSKNSSNSPVVTQTQLKKRLHYDHNKHAFSEEAIKANVDQAMRRPCILCGGKPDGFVVFEPSDEEVHKYGGFPGKPRIIVYGLCIQCATIDDFAEQCEAKLQKAVIEAMSEADESLLQLPCLCCLTNQPDHLHIYHSPVINENIIIATCKQCRDKGDMCSRLDESILKILEAKV